VEDINSIIKVKPLDSIFETHLDGYPINSY